MPHDNDGSDDDDGVHVYDDVHVSVQSLFHHPCQLYALFQSIPQLVALQGHGLFLAVGVAYDNVKRLLAQCSLANLTA